ncbi:zinc finger A20 and AN1 domain-containing stress-associated protein [Musa troglodytarum]|uniref:Zinc finger A20 and AN1 domain-containing stress-associated protein n=1 Tax=Musa troglodytarum TaxID=320322 RepID=A0A9E7HPP4_9LILI|nr:zinc finger A20 and AN1 domain-containing stress-associated protein [Musa troglodytarum]
MDIEHQQFLRELRTADTVHAHQSSTERKMRLQTMSTYLTWIFPAAIARFRGGALWSLGLGLGSSKLTITDREGKQSPLRTDSSRNLLLANLRMDHDETGCQAPEGPILCINNCGFFGSAATMNMCSKCHREMILKQEQAKLAASSIDNLVNGSGGDICSSNSKDPVISSVTDVGIASGELKAIPSQSPGVLCSSGSGEAKAKNGPNRWCSTCRKRVGLTGFRCRCGDLFCPTHRYSDKHGCPFDYQRAASDAIAKANPVVKAEKLDKI